MTLEENVVPKSQRNYNKQAFALSLVSIFISFFAVVFAGLQWWDAHNQLISATKPMVNFAVEEANLPLGIVIENGGLGPAIIKSLDYYLDKKRVSDWNEVMRQFLITDNSIVQYELEDDYVLSPANKFWAIKYEKSNGPSHEVALVEELLDKHIGVKINYCDVRGNCLAKCSTPHFCDD
jgi:hypothetical protein